MNDGMEILGDELATARKRWKLERDMEGHVSGTRDIWACRA